MAQDPNIDFVKEQYAQYWEMKRKHLSLSWQIPALTVVAVVAVIGLDPENITKWRDMPLVPAIGFLVLGIFVALMFVHHYRNLLFASLYDRVLAEIEKEYGKAVKIHHFQVRSVLKWWQQISSSTGLSVFLALLSMCLLLTSAYYFFLL